MATKQYHFRVDDDALNAGIAHEYSKQGASMTGVLVELLLLGLEQKRVQRERDALMAHLAQQMGVEGVLANPDRVVYRDVDEGDHA